MVQGHCVQVMKIARYFDWLISHQFMFLPSYVPHMHSCSMLFPGGHFLIKVMGSDTEALAAKAVDQSELLPRVDAKSHF